MAALITGGQAIIGTFVYFVTLEHGSSPGDFIRAAARLEIGLSIASGAARLLGLVQVAVAAPRRS